MLIQQKGTTINKQLDCFPNTLKLYTKLKNSISPLNLNKSVKIFNQELHDNNDDFNNGVFLRSTPIHNTSLDYIHRLERYDEKVNLNSHKYSLRSKNEDN